MRCLKIRHAICLNDQLLSGYFYCILADNEPPKKKRRVKKPTLASDEEVFHQKLKDSVVLHGRICDDDELPSDVHLQEQQLKEFQAALETNKQKETYFKCLMGRNLQKIKDSTGKRGKKFVEYAQQFLPKSYERTEIYFMMNLHDLAIPIIACYQ